MSHLSVGEFNNDPLNRNDANETENKTRENEMITNIVDPIETLPTAAIPEMPNQLEKDLVQIFKLLSDETRLRILMYLGREKELHVTALCQKLGQSQPAVSHHLALLRVAGLIEARRDGKHNYYSVCNEHFHRVMGELFRSMGDPERDELRFDDFVLTIDG